MLAFELYVLEQFLKIRNRFALSCEESLYDRMKSIYCAANWSLLSYEDHVYYYNLQAFSEEASSNLCALMPSIDINTQKIVLTPIQHSSDINGNIEYISIEQVMSMIFMERSARLQKIAEINSHVMKSSSHSKVNEFQTDRQYTTTAANPESGQSLKLEDNNSQVTQYVISNTQLPSENCSNALLTDEEITFLEKELQNYKTQFESSGVEFEPHIENAIENLDSMDHNVNLQNSKVLDKNTLTHNPSSFVCSNNKNGSESYLEQFKKFLNLESK